MKFFFALLCLAALSAAPAFAAEETPVPEKKAGIFHRMLHPFGESKPAPATTTPAPAAEKKPGIMTRVLHPFGGKKGAGTKPNGRLVVALKLSPLPLKVPATNRLKVTLTLTNQGKKLVPLDFPTSQRIEVVIKNTAAKTIEQWSQDQAFTNEPTALMINPGERVEYTVEVATREMVAGQTYTVLGFFPGHETLRAEQSVVPEK